MGSVLPSRACLNCSRRLCLIEAARATCWHTLRRQHPTQLAWIRMALAGMLTPHCYIISEVFVEGARCLSLRWKVLLLDIKSDLTKEALHHLGFFNTFFFVSHVCSRFHFRTERYHFLHSGWGKCRIPLKRIKKGDPRRLLLLHLHLTVWLKQVPQQQVTGDSYWNTVGTSLGDFHVGGDGHGTRWFRALDVHKGKILLALLLSSLVEAEVVVVVFTSLLCSHYHYQWESAS